jgi:hypothetical protein
MDRCTTPLEPVAFAYPDGRALEMNPDKFGKLANHRQELWKLPLPDFIEQLYLKRFGKYQARLYVWHGPLALCFRAKSH